MPIVLERFFDVLVNAQIREDAITLKVQISESSFDSLRGPPASVHLELLGAGFNINSNEMGSDLVEAVYLALTKASAILYSSDLWRSGNLLWRGDRDLGLPILCKYVKGRTVSPWE